MPKENEAEHLARIWIEGWIAGKPDDIPLADDFTHSSPFGVISGREKYLEWVKPLAAKNVVSLTIKKITGREENAAIWFEMLSPNGPVQCCDWVHSKDGKITSVNSFYNPTNVR